MEIKEGKTGLGEQMIEFTDQSASDLRMWVEEHSRQGKGTKILYFDTDTDYFKFSQEDIKALLPYLQSFAETGQLEPQSPLQGESAINEAKLELEKAKKEASYYKRQCDQYVDQIANLEELIEDWRNIVERNLGGNKLNEVQKRTIQLLGEDHD